MRFTSFLLLLALMIPVAASAQDCALGNLDPVLSYDAGWIVETARFAQFVDPMSPGCSCTPGVLVEEMRVRLYLAAGGAVMLRAHMLDDDGDAACPHPGATLASSEPYLVEAVERTDLYTLSIPCGFPCAVKDETYFLVVEIMALTGSVEMPFTNGDPDTGIDKQAPGDPCTAWRDVGSGWEDMIGGSFPGGLPIDVMTTCCGEPIAEKYDLWGDVKRIYE